MMVERVVFTYIMLETPSKRDRKLQSIKELNTNTTKDKTVKILLIIDIPPRILANVICPHLYMLAYTISGSGAGLIYFIIFYSIFQLAAYTKRLCTYYPNLLFCTEYC